MDYAMILQYRVIDVLKNQDTIPEWGPNSEGNPVTAIPCDDTVTLGMIYDPETGTFSEYIPPEPEPEPIPEPTQLDRIETALNRTQNEIREEGAAIATAAILPMGAAMTFALADAGVEMPAVAGVFAEEWQNWTADGETAAAKSLWKYNGIGYQTRTAIQKIENYAPDKVPNNYAVRPIPDALGIFPTVMNMDVSIGMKLRGEDGKVYECYANPITSLQWQPGEVPASFRLIEG